MRALEGDTAKAGKSSSELVDRLDTVVAGLEDVGESDGEDGDLSEGEEAELLGELEVCGEGVRERGVGGGGAGDKFPRPLIPKVPRRPVISL